MQVKISEDGYRDDQRTGDREHNTIFKAPGVEIKKS
jgi:hypothetical protein